MPRLSTKSTNAILNESLDQLERTTGISAREKGSLAGYLVRSVMNEVTTLRLEEANVLSESDLSTATGDNLDRLGKEMGLTRRLGTFASVSDSERNLEFYLDSGDFASINGGFGFSIPAGAVISTNPQFNEYGERISFTTIRSAYASPGANQVFVSARCIASGQIGNLGSQTLTVHNFTDYALATSGALKVRNRFRILNGTDLESDALYRARLRSFYAALLGDNLARIRLEALSVPGVLRIELVPNYAGVGTAALFCYGAEEVITQQLLDEVRSKALSYVVPGLTLLVLPGIKIGLELDIRVAVQNATEPVKRKFDLDIQKTFLEYTGGMRAGEAFSRRTLESNLSAALKSKVRIDKVTFTKSYGDSTPDSKETLKGDSLAIPAQHYVEVSDYRVSYVRSL